MLSGQRVHTDSAEGQEAQGLVLGFNTTGQNSSPCWDPDFSPVDWVRQPSSCPHWTHTAQVARGIGRLSAEGQCALTGLGDLWMEQDCLVSSPSNRKLDTLCLQDCDNWSPLWPGSRAEAGSHSQACALGQPFISPLCPPLEQKLLGREQWG